MKESVGFSLDQRRAGVLLHPTSLPNAPGNGDLGGAAYRFIDLLAHAGVSVWQMLPTGPTHASRSPYQCLSVHAGNPLLISFDPLVERGWLNLQQMRTDLGDDASPDELRQQALRLAWQGFNEAGSEEHRNEQDNFIASQSHWLPDYALFRALKDEQDQRAWWDWPAELRDRDPDALAEARKRLADQIGQQVFEQYLFFCQWSRLKSYANKRGVLLYGDMPIFVADDSADVWAEQHYFNLNEQGRPITIAGVPPDYFSATGQRWGNPHYRWDRMEADGFQWWLRRMRSQLAMYDLIRIDHFRGFEAFWEIPAEEETAINGRWVKAPGEALFAQLQEEFGPLPLIAEDLGVITEEVDELRHAFGLPGMKILQFAFGSGAGNPYLPHNHEHDGVVYTGTHDNDTTLGWWNSIDDKLRDEVRDYLCRPEEAMPWPLVRSALASVAALAVVPMQDLLELGTEHRMNVPGVTDGNWNWRFTWEQVPPGLEERVRHLVTLYGRYPG